MLTHFTPTPLAERTDQSNTDPTVLDLFAQQVDERPDDIAVIFDDSQFTYQQLDRNARQFSDLLIKRGVERGDLIAVQMDRDLNLIVALLGILRAGAAYVPIDTHAPAARRAFILHETQAKLLVHQAVPAPESVADVPCLAFPPTLEWTEAAEISSGVQPSASDLMYVLYTSGTTGEPKGVMIEHGGVANILAWMVREYGLTPDDKVLQKTPYTFDASVWELFVPLISGGTLVLAKPGGQRDPRYLIEVTAKEGVTCLQLVPSMLGHMLREPALATCHTLRHVFCGGEVLSRQMQDEFYSALPAQLHNLYGPTETSIQVLTWTCHVDDSRPYVPIGRPISNVLTHVVDTTGQPVAPGGMGELLIGGVAVARGYHGKPELTARRFVFRPDLHETQPRFYCTGDLVRAHQDGSFEFLGRLDDQVKVQGFRIELGEIENCLRRIPGVRNAAVLTETSTATDSVRLVAYLEGMPGALRLVDLRAALSAHLPDYMIPAVFKVLEGFPLTAHGKLDKASLPQLPTETLVAETDGEGASTRAEQTLAEIWADVLGVKSIGVRDDFFELGGDSIAALIVIARAKQRGLTVLPDELLSLRQIQSVAAAAVARA